MIEQWISEDELAEVESTDIDDTTEKWMLRFTEYVVTYSVLVGFLTGAVLVWIGLAFYDPDWMVIVSIVVGGVVAGLVLLYKHRKIIAVLRLGGDQ